MNRLQQILLAILVVQIGLVVAIYWPQEPTASMDAPMFSELNAGDIVAFSVDDADDSHVDLTKSGDEWVVSSAGDYPCDGEKIYTALEKIPAIHTSRLVTRTEDSHKRLQVADDDFSRRVIFELADGSQHTLFIGTAPRAKATHVRKEGQNDVYLTGEITSWEFGANASSWIDTAYLSILTDEITTMVLTNANGTFEFEKDADGSWSMSGLDKDEELNQVNLNSLLNQFSSFQMTKPLGKQELSEYGLDSPNAVVKLNTQNEDKESKIYTLQVGAKDTDDNSYVVKSSESRYYVKVAGYSIDNFVNYAREDFIQQDPTPTP